MIFNYSDKFIEAEDAVKAVKSNHKVWLHANSCFPDLLVSKLLERYRELQNVTFYQLTTFNQADFVEPEMKGHFTLNALFTSGNVRKAVNEGRADFTPAFLSEIPRMLEESVIPVDVCLLHLSVPDEHGYCSFGVSNECSKIAAECAKIKIAQINPKMPRVLGDNFIHISKLDYIVWHDKELIEVKNTTKDLSDEDKAVYDAIGNNIAELIKDGDTLQMGIGAIPDAVLPLLREKRDLGVHTEMFSDGLVDLMEAGIVHGSRKNFLKDKVVSSFLIGSKKVFDFVDNNPLIEFRSTKFVNDPFVIARNDNLVSINSAIEVDFTGQVCADSIGYRNYSGFGGQVDFVRGAIRSKGGRSIIALPSTAKGGAVSRIVSCLKEGAGVTTSRGDVNFVATEFGVANLWGKTMRERVKSMINIAHPDFREELERKAREVKFLWD
ncbi:MAG: acetyl-CoA hydrolase [Chlorobi bacterium OLB4]|jgi:Acetyl-CoA hydrolase|nr:MAG: acetyl-CoA hydrolase [Chlorobi bacterium OLB4]MBW7855888.1 acetyl-CoA hydrolase/transferase family protein [Ignavibacteria bacterium]OQY76624.1 MAG: 4-hydroxybutyrate CoA-transferase [Ignavibacteriales bacterium UTCHB1]